MFEAINEVGDKLEFEVFSHSDGVFTVTTVKAENFEGLGVAKRHPSDEVDDSIGFQLSLARAFIDFGEAFEAEVKGEL